ncbi:MAG: AsmA-like C-terminal region-containing protein [Candidatus Omnitrophota bacterium]
MKKKITFILLALMMLGTVAFFYVNHVLLPGQVKRTIEKKISEYTQRLVSIEKISFKITKGISLENILIKETDGQRTFLQIDEIYFNILLIPFLKDKTVILPALTVKKPAIQVIHYADGSFNLSDIATKKEAKAADKNYKVFVTKIKVSDGKVDYLKKSPDQDFSESFRNLNLDLAISANKQLSYQIRTYLPLEQSDVSAKGQYWLGSHKVAAQLSLTNVNILKYLRQFYPPEQIRLNAGQLSNAEVNVQYNQGKLNFTGDAYLTNADIQLNPDDKLSGNIRLLNASVLIDRPHITAKGELRIPLTKVEFGLENSYEGDIRAIVQSMTYTLNDHHFRLDGNIKADNSEIILKNNNKFSGNLTSRDMTLSYEDQKLSIAGDFDSTNTHLYFSEKQQYDGHVTARNFSLDQANDRLTVKSLLKSENSYIIFGENKLLNSKISTDDFYLEQSGGVLTMKSNLKFDEAVIAFQHGYKFQGAPELDIQYSHSFNNNGKPELKGLLTFNSGLITGLPYIETASNINGELKISDNRIYTKSTTFNAENTNLTIAGQISDLTNMDLDLLLSTENIELKRVMKFFPDFIRKHKIELAGLSAVQISFQGKSAGVNNAEISADAQLKDSTLMARKLPSPFRNINGSIHYSKDRFKWSDLSGVYQDFPFKIDGELVNFSKPVIHTSLLSTNLNARSKIQLYNNTIRFPELDAKYFHSEFSGSADIYLFENSAPDFQVTGRAVVAANDLPNFFPAHKDKLVPLEMDGTIDTNVFFKGKLDQWEDWSLSLDGKTPALTVRKHPLTGVKITYLQRDKNISKLNLVSDLYQGKLNVVSSVNLENKQLPFKLTVDLFGMDLAELAQKQKLKYDKLAGKGTLNLEADGNWLDQMTWKGKGKFDVKDGYLWQLNIIQGLSNVLLIKEFTHTVYTTSRADFKIKDRKIYSENLYLESSTMKLNSKGWVDFDQKLDIEVYPTLSEIAMIQSESIKKITSALLAQNISYIKVTGTIKDPKIDAKTSPIDILKNTTGVIKEGIGGIVDGILRP